MILIHNGEKNKSQLKSLGKSYEFYPLGVLPIGILKIHMRINICCIYVCTCEVHYFVENPSLKFLKQNNRSHTYIHIYNIYLYIYESLELPCVEHIIGSALNS